MGYLFAFCRLLIFEIVKEGSARMFPIHEQYSLHILFPVILQRRLLLPMIRIRDTKSVRSDTIGGIEIVIGP
jgi:hypothetical protein